MHGMQKKHGSKLYQKKEQTIPIDVIYIVAYNKGRQNDANAQRSMRKAPVLEHRGFSIP